MAVELSSYKQQTIEKAIDNFGEQFHGGERAWEIYQNWFRQAFFIPEESLNKIGELWITEILDCNENTVDTFMQDEVNDEIGLKHAGVIDYKANSRGFWEGVRIAAPNLVAEKDLDYIIEEDHNGAAAWALISALDEINPRMDCLPSKLVSNALLYK